MLNELRIPIHSVVDIITNSSTTIFTEVNKSAVNVAKELIGKILAATGQEHNVDDLFEFEIEKQLDDENPHYMLSYPDDYGLDEEEVNKAFPELEKLDEDEKNEFINQNEERVMAFFNKMVDAAGDDYCSERRPKWKYELVIKPKNGEAFDFLSTVRSAIDIEAEYD